MCSKILGEAIPSLVGPVYIDVMHGSIHSLLVYLISLLEAMNHSVDFPTIEIGYSDGPIL